MKKLVILLLVLALVLPVSAAGTLVYDGSGLLTAQEAQQLEADYAAFAQSNGFTPILVTTDSFDGLSAEDYAGEFYDSHAFPDDGMLLLVSFTEGEWYLLTNGACAWYISDYEAEDIGETVVPVLQAGAYYDAAVLFTELAGEVFAQNNDGSYGQEVDLTFGEAAFFCIPIGLVIGLIVAGIMALKMKSVSKQHSAADYVRPGSMQLTNQRDIFLYSQVTRTPRPKNNSSSGGGGGSRGGAGGKL